MMLQTMHGAYLQWKIRESVGAVPACIKTKHDRIEKQFRENIRVTSSHLSGLKEGKEIRLISGEKIAVRHRALCPVSHISVVSSFALGHKVTSLKFLYNCGPRPTIIHPLAQRPSSNRHENRLPLMLLKGVLVSYLLFSTTRCDSVDGACLVGAGSLLDSWLGEPAVSVLAAGPGPLLFVSGVSVPPIAADDSGRLGTLSEYSIDSMASFCFFRWSNFAFRSALMFCLAT
jgi:hypothetical protein